MQSTNSVLMIRPVAFGYNAQTAVNNYFQVEEKDDDVQGKALKEFDTFVDRLRTAGIDVIVVQDTAEPHTPDSIFPNNWVSFHENGRVVLYPMFAGNRRWERRRDILKEIEDRGYVIKEILDYSPAEKDGKYLEGTGSMILDHENQIAYGTVSLRLDENLFRKWSADFGYEPVIFHSFQSVGDQRLPIYHTNVMMCVADQYAVVCLDSIDDETERTAVIEKLRTTGKEIVEISESQMHRFAGNMLQVRNSEGKRFLVMSGSAYESLRPEQISAIERYDDIISSDLETIETNGGGSARCMLAEIFLPRK